MQGRKKRKYNENMDREFKRREEQMGRNEENYTKWRGSEIVQV